MTEAISLTESKRLIQLEKIIKAGEKVFVEVGNALLEIRDAKLYRADFSTFDEYCQEKWGWGRQRGYELIIAAKTVQALPKSVIGKITNENQAAALSKIPPRRQPAVIEKIEKSGKPITAGNITKAATPPPPRKLPAKPAPQPEREIVRDELGMPIIDALLPTWERRHEIQACINHLNAAKKMISDAQENNAVSFGFVSNLQGEILKIEAVVVELKAGKAYAQCPACQGHGRDTCGNCKHTGFIGKFHWEKRTTEKDQEVHLAAIKAKK